MNETKETNLDKFKPATIAEIKAAFEENEECEDCGGEGFLSVDCWSYSKEQHYTKDTPCHCQSEPFEQDEDMHPARGER